MRLPSNTSWRGRLERHSARPYGCIRFGLFAGVSLNSEDHYVQSRQLDRECKVRLEVLWPSKRALYFGPDRYRCTRQRHNPTPKIQHNIYGAAFKAPAVTNPYLVFRSVSLGRRILFVFRRPSIASSTVLLVLLPSRWGPSVLCTRGGPKHEGCNFLSRETWRTSNPHNESKAVWVVKTQRLHLHFTISQEERLFIVSK